MNRSEHLEWAKNRALEYIELDDPQEALMSLMSDLSKHEDLRWHKNRESLMLLILSNKEKSPEYIQFLKTYIKEFA
jgi:hypothetical protein